MEFSQYKQTYRGKFSLFPDANKENVWSKRFQWFQSVHSLCFFNKVARTKFSFSPTSEKMIWWSLTLSQHWPLSSSSSSSSRITGQPLSPVTPPEWQWTHWVCVGCGRGTVQQHGPAAGHHPRTSSQSEEVLPAGGANERVAYLCQDEQRSEVSHGRTVSMVRTFNTMTCWRQYNVDTTGIIVDYLVLL